MEKFSSVSISLAAEMVSVSEDLAAMSAAVGRLDLADIVCYCDEIN